MRIKSFITCKRGRNEQQIQDSIAINEEIGRFALSDGVSSSAQPKLWADLLTSGFVKSDADFPFIIENLTNEHINRRDAFIETLNNEDRFYENLAIKRRRTASATFIGVQLKADRLQWQLIGDSCLFLIDADGKVECHCSNDVQYDEDGRILVEFSDYTYQIHSDGMVYGEWLYGERTFTAGKILMMSDKLSEWFIRQHNERNNPIEQLEMLNSNDEFKEFVDAQYYAGLLENDDTSAIVISLDNADTENITTIKTVNAEEKLDVSVENQQKEIIYSEENRDGENKLLDKRKVYCRICRKTIVRLIIDFMTKLKSKTKII